MSSNPNDTSPLSSHSSEKTFQAELARPEPTPSRPTCGAWFFILFMIAVVVGPVLYFWLPGEIARWHHASLIEQDLNGDLAGAIQTLNGTIAQYPNQAGLYIQRAEWYLRLEKYRPALADCNRAVELEPRSLGGYLLRSQVHQHLGEYEKGIENMLQVLELSEKIPQFQGGAARATALNGLAYARALARSDLENALQEIDEALSILGADEGGAMLDTRGYIHYLREDFESARKDLEQAVDSVEKEYGVLADALKGEHPGVVDLRDSQRKLQATGQKVAVIRYHRALLYQALQMETEAQQDLQRVRELGHEPGDQLF